MILSYYPIKQHSQLKIMLYYKELFILGKILFGKLIKKFKKNYKMKIDSACIV